MSQETHTAFLGIVLGGSHKDKGMISFSEMLSEDQTDAIHQYLISQANTTYKLLQSSK